MGFQAALSAFGCTECAVVAFFVTAFNLVHAGQIVVAEEAAAGFDAVFLAGKCVAFDLAAKFQLVCGAAGFSQINGNVDVFGIEVGNGTHFSVQTLIRAVFTVYRAADKCCAGGVEFRAYLVQPQNFLSNVKFLLI